MFAMTFVVDGMRPPSERVDVCTCVHVHVKTALVNGSHPSHCLVEVRVVRDRDVCSTETVSIDPERQRKTKNVDRVLVVENEARPVAYGSNMGLRLVSASSADDT